MKLSINEIFYSIQGEGFHSGTPAVFVRTAGCNLLCPFCDTDFTERERLSIENILLRIENYPARFVVLTGGEPTLQPEACTALVTGLRSKGYYVALETNGTSRDALGADWVTVSPKRHLGRDWVMRKGDELKVVYQGHDISPYERSHFTHYYLQPPEVKSPSEFNLKTARNAWRNPLAAILDRPKWKLSLQLHKILDIP